MLDELAKCTAVHREVYGYNKLHKPNSHCNWERVHPTTTSIYGWVENDDHFRTRVKSKMGNKTNVF